MITSPALQLRRAFFPLTERTFTYARYKRCWTVSPTKTAFASCRSASFLLPPTPIGLSSSLRHDVDERLDRAADFARLEHERGLRATYYVLQTARYWQDARARCRRSFACRTRSATRSAGTTTSSRSSACSAAMHARTLASELERLRGAGLRIVGTSSHGSPACYRYGFHNGYFFSRVPVAGFPNVDVVDGPLGPKPVPRGTLEEFGFDYEAYHLDHDRYFSDAAFDASGARWHTEQLDLSECTPGSRTIILTHPDHWDASAVRKLGRYAWKIADKMRR